VVPVKSRSDLSRSSSRKKGRESGLHLVTVEEREKNETAEKRRLKNTFSSSSSKGKKRKGGTPLNSRENGEGGGNCR